MLRKKPPGKLLPGAHAIEREYLVMEALGRAGVPSPPLHGLCEDSSILGTPFYLMSFVPGRIFKNPALPGLAHQNSAGWAAVPMPGGGHCKPHSKSKTKSFAFYVNSLKKSLKKDKKKKKKSKNKYK